MLQRFKNLEKSNLNILFNVLMAFVIKGGALIIYIFTIPAYMRYFDNKILLGVWFTMLSVLTWVLEFDLGIGNGLRNRLVDTFVNKNYKRAKEYISSAYVIITLIAMSIALVGYIICPHINWNLFFNISEGYISASVLLKTVRIVLFGILVQFVLRIVISILYALQHSFVPNLLNLISAVMLLVYVLKSPSITAEHNIVMLAYANIITVNLPLFVTTIIVFTTKLKNCMPSARLFKKQYASDVMKLGGIFFWLQIMTMLLFNTNEYLITWFLSPFMVVDYQIYNRIFSLGGYFVYLAMTPIWSAVTKAKAKNNYKWIRKLNYKLMLLGLLGICIEIMIVPITQIIINLWLRDNAIKVNYIYAIIFAVSGSLFLWSNVITTMSNGLGELKIQVIFVTIGALSNIPMAFIGAKLFHSYIAIVIANFISLAPYCIIQPIWFNRYIKKKVKQSDVSLMTESGLA